MVGDLQENELSPGHNDADSIDWSFADFPVDSHSDSWSVFVDT